MLEDHETGPFWVLDLVCGHRIEKLPRHPVAWSVPEVWPQLPPTEANCLTCSQAGVEPF